MYILLILYIHRVPEKMDQKYFGHNFDKFKYSHNFLQGISRR